jgi:hypothetical protein
MRRTFALVAAAVIALAWINSPWGDAYHRVLELQRRGVSVSCLRAWAFAVSARKPSTMSSAIRPWRSSAESSQ